MSVENVDRIVLLKNAVAAIVSHYVPAPRTLDDWNDRQAALLMALGSEIAYCLITTKPEIVFLEKPLIKVGVSPVAIELIAEVMDSLARMSTAPETRH